MVTTLGNITLRSNQEEPIQKAIDFFKEKKPIPSLIVLPTACHAKGTMIPLYDGTKKPVEDIVVGDMLIGDDGYPREVLELHSGVDEMYRITPAKGKPFVVNGNHILHLYKTPEGNRYPCEKDCYHDISVIDYIGKAKFYKHIHKLCKPEAIHFDNHSPLEIEPYLLGIFLGDGCSCHDRFEITSMEPEIEEYLNGYAERNGMRISVSSKINSKAKTYKFCNKVRQKKQIPLIEQLKKIGLLGLKADKKFIPIDYKTSSKENRLQLLAGLLDTDAWLDIKGNQFEYCSKSISLADDIYELSISLGLSASIHPKILNEETYYRVIITGNLSTIPNRVARRKGRNRFVSHRENTSPFTVEKIGIDEYYGFTVTGNHLYCDEQLFIHHNCGKSILTAFVAYHSADPILVVQPSKELLEQNYDKYNLLCGESGAKAGIYSASFNKKEVEHITYATIGSIKNLGEEFKKMGFKKMLIDEAHLYPREADSMLGKFLSESGITHVLGITATPIKLQQNYDVFGNTFSKLVMLTSRSKKGNFFKRIIHVGQISEMVNLHYWSPLIYEPHSFNQENLIYNSTRSEFTEKSVQEAYEAEGGLDRVIGILDEHKERNHILVFLPSIADAQDLADRYPGCEALYSGMPAKERKEIIERFKSGITRVIGNVSIVSTGFDYTGIDCIIMARSTASIALYYQIIGRATRIESGKKDAVIIDIGGNYERFGKVEDITYEQGSTGQWRMFGSGGKLLSGIPITEIGYVVREDVVREDEAKTAKIEDMPFGKYKGVKLTEIPKSYKKWMLENFDWSGKGNLKMSILATM